MDVESLITETELARATGTSRRMWQDLRQHGGGPEYVRLSARCVRYRLSAVQRWLSERTYTRVDGAVLEGPSNSVASGKRDNG